MSSTTAADPLPTAPVNSVPIVPVVPVKKANQPFLVHQKWKAEQAAAKADGNPQAAASLPVSSFVSVLKWTVLALLTSLLLSRTVTSSWLWGYEGKYSNPSKVLSLLYPSPLVTLNAQMLALHDGSNPAYPVYLAIDGEVYDVSASAQTYGPGGSYHVFAGKDATRAFVTGCFKDHLTHDTRGFTGKEERSLDYWKKFYAGHAKYTKVGRVVLPPIDPSSPLPEPC